MRSLAAFLSAIRFHFQYATGQAVSMIISIDTRDSAHADARSPPRVTATMAGYTIEPMQKA